MKISSLLGEEKITRLVAEERVLGKLLSLSLQPLNMAEFLSLSIEAVISGVPWLRLLPTGGVFLTSADESDGHLELVASHNFSPPLLELCANIPFGHCMCGRAAAERKIQFSDNADYHHEIQFDGMEPHGHYSVPILGEGQLLGVMVFYTPPGEHKDSEKEEFLTRVGDTLSMGILNRRAKEELIAAKEVAEAASRQLDTITRNIPGLIFRRLVEANGTVTVPFFSGGSSGGGGFSAEVQEQLVEGTLKGLRLVHEDDIRRLDEACLRAASLLSPLSLEYRVHLNDEVRWIHCIAQPQRLENEAVMWDGLLLDITEQKSMEYQLAQAQKLESVGQLAAGIAHEINTPTQFVSDNTRFLKEAFTDIRRLVDAYEEAAMDLPPERRHAIEQVASEIDHSYLNDEIPSAINQSLDGLERIMRIVRAMKEFSHPGGSEKTPVDINRAIRTTLDVSRNEWKYDALIELQLAPTIPSILGFPGEINQVLLNIVVNAAQAISAARHAGRSDMGHITIATREREGRVEIEITDDGPGMEEGVKSRVFDPFFTTKPVGKGTGQGLAIAYSSVVDKHQGEITVASKPGEGTTFLVCLPINATT